ncbi:biopolymer transporter ExbD [candidate division WOR-3 bacterium]|nr:biopolymer transporter ExbD [candidate division WOR-3 bacterium]
MPEHKQQRSLVLPIIPMAGVALIIVLMMMITAQELMAHENTEMNVPVAQPHERSRKTEDNVTVAVLENPTTNVKEYYYNDELMSLEHLELKLKDTIQKAEPGMLVVLRADSSAPSQWVLELLSKAKDAGAQRVAISTKERKEEENKEAAD